MKAGTFKPCPKKLLNKPKLDWQPNSVYFFKSISSKRIYKGNGYLDNKTFLNHFISEKEVDKCINNINNVPKPMDSVGCNIIFVIFILFAIGVAIWDYFENEMWPWDYFKDTDQEDEEWRRTAIYSGALLCLLLIPCTTWMG